MDKLEKIKNIISVSGAKMPPPNQPKGFKALNVAEVFNYIESYYSKNYRCPSIQKIQRRFNKTSPSPVQQTIRSLLEQGYLRTNGFNRNKYEPVTHISVSEAMTAIAAIREILEV